MTAPLLSGSVVRNEALWAQGLDAYPTSTGDALAATWERTLRFNPTASLGRWLGRQRLGRQDTEGPDAGFVDVEGGTFAAPQPQPVPRLSAQEANERYGLDGQLKFEDGVPQPVAEELNALKREELRQADILRRSPGGFVQGAGELAVGFAGGAIDPLNIATAFIPVVGQARFASWAANGVTRARLAKGAIEGAVGAVLIEPVVLGVAQSEQADYTATDSLLNVAFGTALGGGLHVGAGWLGDRFGAKALEEREAQLRGAVADLVDKGAVAPSTAQALEARIAGDELPPTEASGRQAPIAQRLRFAWQAALGKDKPVARMEIEPVTPAAADKLGALFAKAGLPFDAAGFRHVVEYDTIRHIEEKHGARAGEDARGQRPVTAEEFARLPEVLRNPDDVQPGKSVKGVAATIVFEKKLDGRYYVVEQVRAGKRTLAVKTMYVVPEKPEGAAAAKGSMAVPRNAPELNVRNTIAAADGVVANSGDAAKPVLPYVAVPAAGQRLAAFVRSWGGIKNEGQEVAALMGRVNGRPGLIDNSKGMSIDDMARHAWEAGYFTSREDRPTVAEFLDLLDRDINGKPVFRADDVSGYDRDAAIKINEEIDQLSAAFDVPVEGKTYAEFFDAVGERMTFEEAAAREAALADDIAATYDRLNAERQAFLETRWDTWAPDIWAEPRDLGAMERDYAAEFEKAAGLREGAGGRQPGAGGTAADGELARGLRGDPQQGDGGARAAGDRQPEIDPDLNDPNLDLADADLASAVARSQADLDALIAAGLVRADDPEILMAADLAARVDADARAHDAAAFCLGRNA